VHVRVFDICMYLRVLFACAFVHVFMCNKRACECACVLVCVLVCVCMYARTYSTKIWTPINMILFGLVPLELRTLVCMGFHYVFLVGLALWDATVTAEKTIMMASTAGQFQGESLLDSAGTQ